MEDKNNELVVIRRHNNVVDAPEKGTMSLFERQILLYLQGIGYGSGEREFEIDIREFKLPGKSLTTGQKTSLDKACQRLNAAQIREPSLTDKGKLKYENPKLAKIDSVSSIKYINVFSEIELNFKLGKIKAVFNDKFLPYLSRMDSHYTSYLFSDIKVLRKPNSARIYELIERGLDIYNSREFGVNEFLDLLGYPARSSYRKQFREIRRRILDPCLEEITEKTKVNATWEITGKRGNSISKFSINWTLKGEKVTEIGETIKDVEHEEVTSDPGPDVSELKRLVSLGLLSKSVLEQVEEAKQKEKTQKTQKASEELSKPQPSKKGEEKSFEIRSLKVLELYAEKVLDEKIDSSYKTKLYAVIEKYAEKMLSSNQFKNKSHAINSINKSLASLLDQFEDQFDIKELIRVINTGAMTNELYLSNLINEKQVYKSAQTSIDYSTESENTNTSSPVDYIKQQLQIETADAERILYKYKMKCNKEGLKLSAGGLIEFLSNFKS